jgi:peptide/nickel transport system substrate-binding protein
MAGSGGVVRRVAGLVGCMVLLVACSGGSDGQEEGQESGAEGNDASTLVAAIGEGDPMEWDPEIDNEKSSIHFGDTLTQLNPETLELEPALAESWELSEDGTTWTFRLRPDVPFHDGWGTVTAEDVKFTWSEWASEDSDHGSRAVLARQAVDGDMDNFEIVSDLEFRLHTTQPVVALPEVLCSCATGMTVTSARYFAETDPEEANSHPIGTGPWQFVSSDPGVEIVMERAEGEHPWRETPAYDRFILRIIPDGAARLAQVQSGAVDVGELQAELTGEAEAAGLQIVSNTNIGHADMMLGGMYYGDAENLDTEAPWIQGDSPDSEAGRAVREAMSLAIDRELILDRILHGQGELSYGPLIQYNSSPLTVDDSWELPAYDPERARQRLADGGYPDGFPVEVLLFPQEVDTVGMGEAVAGMWEEIGLQVTLTPVEEDLVDELLATKDTAGRAWLNINPFYQNPNPTWINYLDNDSEDYKMFHPAITEAYPQVVAEPDQERRWAIARAVTSEMIEDFAPINLMAVNMPFVLSADVASFDPYPTVNTINSLETVRPAE